MEAVDLVDGRGRPLREPGATSPTILVRTAKGLGRLLLNWGVLALIVAAALVVRHRVEAQARAPLPPPAAHLSSASARHWQSFPAYHQIVPVLIYHGVRSGRPGLSVTPHQFAEQMLALRTAGFHAITLAQYVKFARRDHPRLPREPVLITFDDGRLSTYQATNDVLRKYGFHAVMFTFGAWPTSNPGSSLTWSELRAMQDSGIWSIQEAGGSGHDYVIYDSAGDRGAVYAFRQYVPGQSGYGGHLEGFASFLRRVTSSILWGEHQFAVQLPDFRPMAFAAGNVGQTYTNDPRIPKVMFPWLSQHFSVVFGDDYLSGARGAYHGRFSRRISFGIGMNSRMTLRDLYCRLSDWVTGKPLSKEYGCIHPATTTPPVPASYLKPH